MASTRFLATLSVKSESLRAVVDIGHCMADDARNLLKQLHLIITSNIYCITTDVSSHYLFY